MGQHIAQKSFTKSDFNDFQTAVLQETALLKRWFQEHYFTENSKEIGFELEGWLLSNDFLPKPANSQFIAEQANELLVTEVAKSCLEINSEHFYSNGNVFSEHEKKLTALTQKLNYEAEKNFENIIYIGTLPSATLRDYLTDRLTDEDRYHLIDNMLLKLRNHKDIKINILGEAQSLGFVTNSLATIGATSSFQIHFRVGLADSARYYNTAEIISAPMIAVACNSPCLFGHILWDENRIPLLEQMVIIDQDCFPRTTFGSHYLKHSMLELFFENLQYTALLPTISNQISEDLYHLRLHNGTIYRWNRPVIGFENNIPHLRIEHRPMPAGPSIIDMCANAAFFVGLMQFIATQPIPMETYFDFNMAKRNFYRAAKFGLNAELEWIDHKKILASELILTKLLPMAFEGLNQLDINKDDIKKYLTIIKERTQKMQNGSLWQKAFLHKNNDDVIQLTKAYLAMQKLGKPIHEWPLQY